MLQQLATGVVFNGTASGGAPAVLAAIGAAAAAAGATTEPSSQQLDPIYARLRDDTRFWIQRVLVPSLVVVGSFGNIVTVIIMTRRRMRSTTNMYLAALALVDMLYLMLTFLLGVSHYPNMDELKYYAYWRMKPFIMMLTDACSNTSVWLTVTFTIERYIAVRFPMKGKVWCTEERAKGLIVLVFAFGILFALPVPLEWEVIERDQEEQHQHQQLQPAAAAIPSQHQPSGNSSMGANQQSHALPGQTDYYIADGLAPLGAPVPPNHDNGGRNGYANDADQMGAKLAAPTRRPRTRKVLVLDYTEFGKNDTYKTYYYRLTAVIFYFIPLISLILFNGFLIKSVHDSRKERILMSRMQETSDAKTPPRATGCKAAATKTRRPDQDGPANAAPAAAAHSAPPLSAPPLSAATAAKAQLADCQTLTGSGKVTSKVYLNDNNNNNYLGSANSQTGEHSPSSASSFSTILSTKLDSTEPATVPPVTTYRQQELGTCKPNVKLRPSSEAANLGATLNDGRQATATSETSSRSASLSASLAQLGEDFQASLANRQLASPPSASDGLSRAETTTTSETAPGCVSQPASGQVAPLAKQQQHGIVMTSSKRPDSMTPARPTGVGSTMINGRQASARTSHQASSSGGGGGASSQERRITIMLIAVVILFLVCQVPTAAMLIYTSVHDTIPGTNEYALLLTFGNIFNFLIALNAAGNFILYSFLSRKYRRTFVLLFCKCWGKRRPFWANSNAQLNSTTANNNHNNPSSFASLGAGSNFRMQVKSRNGGANNRQRNATTMAPADSAGTTSSYENGDTTAADTPV